MYVYVNLLIFEWMVWKQWQNLVLLDVLMDGKNYHYVIVSCSITMQYNIPVFVFWFNGDTFMLAIFLHS